MYARVTHYKMKSGSREAATALLDSMREEIMAMPGMVRFINVMNDDGAGHVVALTTNQTLTEEAAARVQQLWARFGEFLETAPERGDYHLIADWET